MYQSSHLWCHLRLGSSDSLSLAAANISSISSDQPASAVIVIELLMRVNSYLAASYHINFPGHIHGY